jgi:hypothetical protein
MSTGFLFDAGLKLSFTGANGEQRANQLCEANPDETSRLGPRTVLALRPIRLEFLSADRIAARPAHHAESHADSAE